MELTELETIAVLGAGDMGHGIAALALTAGYQVNLRDIKEEFLQHAREKMGKLFQKMVAKGKLTQEQADNMLQNNLHTYTDLGEAVRGAQVVIEAIPEVLSLKIDTFRQLDELAPPEAFLASNSSTMSITEMAKATRRPKQVLGLHFFNPPLVMKLVEIIQTEITAPETVDFFLELCKKLGKEPVVARKDVPGFIANRVSTPIAAYLSIMLDVEHLDPRDIDATMKKAGLPMGTCLLLDYTGLDLCVNTQRYYVETLGPDYDAPEIIKSMVAAGHYGKKTGQGFYDWSNGMPEIDTSLATGRYDPKVVAMLQANEAGKLVDQGVCTFEDVDKAMKHGYNFAVGPVEAVQNYRAEELTTRLKELEQKYGRTIFHPAKSIETGAYLR